MALGGQPITSSMAKEVAMPRQRASTLGSTPSKLGQGDNDGQDQRRRGHIGHGVGHQGPEHRDPHEHDQPAVALEQGEEEIGEIAGRARGVHAQAKGDAPAEDEQGGAPLQMIMDIFPLSTPEGPARPRPACRAPNNPGRGSPWSSTWRTRPGGSGRCAFPARTRARLVHQTWAASDSGSGR
jgi:hypothetical protein